MKKWIICLITFFSGYFSFAQNPIKFLGIPVDGTKTNMIAELKKKGFVYDSDLDILEGEFNGHNVNISVVTNSNKVYRIFVADIAALDETGIKIRFNKLFNQFLKNGKYDLLDGEILSDEEDVAYEIAVNSKRYEASFIPKDQTIHGIVWYIIADYAGKYYIAMYYDNIENQADGEDL